MTSSWRLGFVACCVAVAGCGSTAECRTPYANSPQFKSCLFANPPNVQTPPSASSWAIWWRFFFGTKGGTVPIDAIPVQPLTRAQLEALNAQANHIVRLGHSSHLLKLAGKFWLIDPVFGERVSPFSFIGPKRFHASPLPLAQLPPIEGLILSHDHYDHLDEPTIVHLAQRVNRYFVPLGLKARLIDMGVPAEQIQEFDWWDGATHAGVQLTATPAQHFSGRTFTDRNSTLWASWVLQIGAQRIYYSGDTGYFEGFKQIGERFGGFDLALIENGAYDTYWPAVHMMPQESIQAFQDLRAKVLLPVHNSTFDLAFHSWHDPLDRLAALAEAQNIDLATPEIGEILTLGQARINKRWWLGLK